MQVLHNHFRLWGNQGGVWEAIKPNPHINKVETHTCVSCPQKWNIIQLSETPEPYWWTSRCTGTITIRRCVSQISFGSEKFGPSELLNWFNLQKWHRGFISVQQKWHDSERLWGVQGGYIPEGGGYTEIVGFIDAFSSKNYKVQSIFLPRLGNESWVKIWNCDRQDSKASKKTILEWESSRDYVTWTGLQMRLSLDVKTTQLCAKSSTLRNNWTPK